MHAALYETTLFFKAKNLLRIYFMHPCRFRIAPRKINHRVWFLTPRMTILFEICRVWLFYSLSAYVSYFITSLDLFKRMQYYAMRCKLLISSEHVWQPVKTSSKKCVNIMFGRFLWLNKAGFVNPFKKRVRHLAWKIAKL